jgi:hypothetical protein
LLLYDKPYAIVAKEIRHSAMEEHNIPRLFWIGLFDHHQKIFAGFLDKVGGQFHHTLDIFARIVCVVVIGP